ncbi:uncharacterized protein N7484_007230 [Penicillium longicatenatum]|uniref:uncharacterized protein n=1 Tax=Penicillium longicatenatum TaxID=1561947 RepID=UPI0025481D0A|nr:uncharacterized protein N7484_007230 [Penicillium longicatenatum]KAJ5639368.1 hypothetical protein N7484_007230 [Penicillium longicatenatum]
MPVQVNAKALLYFVFILGGAISLILGALSWSRTAAVCLPLPTWVPAIATLISPITVLTLIAARYLSRPSNNETQPHRWSTISSILNQIQTIILTIVATVALAYIFPDKILSCNLDQQWQAFFHSKNSNAIRSIQDEFRCCGLRSIHDRAWPFKDRNYGDNACELQLGYQRSCFAPWREHQQRTSWMVVAAAVFVIVAKIAFFQIFAQRTSWMSGQSGSTRPDYQRISHAGVQDEENEGNGGDEEAQRTFLPQSNTQSRNNWET